MEVALNYIGCILLMPLFWGPGESEGVWQVQVHGALREIMHQADLSERVKLADVSGKAGTYGLGAVANLKGEILILDGDAYVSSVVDGGAKVSKADTEGAALLVTAKVDRWQAMPMSDEMHDLNELAAFIEEQAKKAGLDSSGPFPFLIKGEPGIVSWHVIDWPEGDTEHSHEKHKKSGARGELRDETVTLLGFYSDHHQGRFTHHTTNIHVHVRSDNGAVMGHVDALKLFKGRTELWLPLLP